MATRSACAVVGWTMRRGSPADVEAMNSIAGGRLAAWSRRRTGRPRRRWEDLWVNTAGSGRLAGIPGWQRQFVKQFPGCFVLRKPPGCRRQQGPDHEPHGGLSFPRAASSSLFRCSVNRFPGCVYECTQGTETPGLEARLVTGSANVPTCFCAHV